MAEFRCGKYPSPSSPHCQATLPAPICTGANYEFWRLVTVGSPQSLNPTALKVGYVNGSQPDYQAMGLTKGAGFGKRTTLILTGPAAGTLAIPPDSMSERATAIDKYTVQPDAWNEGRAIAMRAFTPFETNPSYVATECQEALQAEIRKVRDRNQATYLENILEKAQGELEHEPKYSRLELTLYALSLLGINVDIDQFWQNVEEYWNAVNGL